ncbi:hypothetical protein ABEP44_12605, partial [Cutibacterium acnes]
PWDVTYAGFKNPKRIYTLGMAPTNYEQDRPFASASGDGLLFVGTTPQYGKIGGALSIYDPKLGVGAAGNPYVVRNLIQDQSITALAYHDGILYGGTSVWGGIGGKPTQPSAKFFGFDVKTKTKLFETVIAENRRTITTVEVGPDGKIWGMCEGYLFKYNPKTGQMEYNNNDFTDIDFSDITEATQRWYGAQLLAG